MPRFKLTIEYVGTRYSGWQIQKNARTIQGEIDRAVRRVTAATDFELYGSGRTDAGVHAAAQVAHLDVQTRLPPETLRRRLNDELPADINVLAMTAVPHRFHARHDARSRLYVYQIARRRTAFAKAYVWWVKEPLDLTVMRTAARSFVGRRDFKALAESDETTQERSTVVVVERLDLVENGDLILVGIQGSHFLWKMVRRIVGVLVEIGRGGLDPEAATELIRQGDTALPARLTAPASGLFLAAVYYEGGSENAPIRPLVPVTPNTS